MSGGVDSSVSALVLRDAGYDVEGVTLKLFDNDDACIEGESTCCSLKDADDARQVCLELGIPHFVYNFTRTFNADVMDRFCNGYLNGETPNPCIDCNRYVKFAALQQRRRELGYDYVATGHYARIAFNEETGRYELKRGLDANKDQSYVLFHLDQETLAHMLFPLGELTKPQVRELASAHGFINAEKAESQDICFVPDGDYAGFISRRTGSTFEPGNIVNRSGKVLGRHNGLIHYTIGQRKGIGVAYSEPLYVFAKNPTRNELVVDTDENTRCTSVEVDDVNFIARTSLREPERFTAKTLYRQTAKPCTVQQTGTSSIRITFDEPQRASAPGQAAVIYDSDTVICGGTISNSL
ncbi:MAG: tRNA 2-thiouridine(34) synthase MnmA [Coriobacteriaceae bacterium]|nr:tRNA 2-thiouridine(34) synthase MnmA [Coriobacteriaceae bacterium]